METATTTVVVDVEATKAALATATKSAEDNHDADATMKAQALRSASAPVIVRLAKIDTAKADQFKAMLADVIGAIVPDRTAGDIYATSLDLAAKLGQTSTDNVADAILAWRKTDPAWKDPNTSASVAASTAKVVKVLPFRIKVTFTDVNGADQTLWPTSTRAENSAETKWMSVVPKLRAAYNFASKGGTMTSQHEAYLDGAYVMLKADRNATATVETKYGTFTITKN